MTDDERRAIVIQFETILTTHTAARHGGAVALDLGCPECRSIWRCLAGAQAAKAPPRVAERRPR